MAWHPVRIGKLRATEKKAYMRKAYIEKSKAYMGFQYTTEKTVKTMEKEWGFSVNAVGTSFSYGKKRFMLYTIH